VTKRRVRLLVVAAILILLLVLLAAYFFYYRSTKKLSFNLTASGTESSILPPEFLFSFSGTGTEKLQSPLGVAVVGTKVYVADSVRHTIFTYDQDGRQTGKFGTTETVTPLYLARNPKDGNIYVTDRRKRAVLKFDQNGKYIGEFDPKLPKAQLPKIETGGVKWVPVALTFANDGTMYVTETLRGHRLLIFSPDGKFKRSIGDVGLVTNPTQLPGVFQFPNGVEVVGNEVYVSDSNNQRIQIFDRDGNFKRFVVTQGLPRGITALLPFPSDSTTKAPDTRIAVVDTLAQFVTIWNGKTAAKLVSFGEQGNLDGQFSFPNGIARGPNNKLFVTDTANGRVEVWGWPDQVAGIPFIGPPIRLLWCLTPLLLIPLLLLTRKRRFVATADFVERMIEMERADLMPARRRAWLTLAPEYELIKEMRYGEIDFGELFEVTEFSESDAKALAEKYELDQPTSELMAAAQRAKVFATQDSDHRRLAKTMEIDVVDAPEFIKRFTKNQSAPTPPESVE